MARKPLLALAGIVLTAGWATTAWLGAAEKPAAAEAPPSAATPAPAQKSAPAEGSKAAGPTNAPAPADTAAADVAAAEAKARILEGVVRDPAFTGRQPNIVILLADDLGYADTGVYGSKEIPTPHIDGLARQGVRFTDAYVTAGTCSPSRAGLLSGRYQERFGFEFNCNVNTASKNRAAVGLDPAAPTLADVMKKGGYATGMVGKWHVGFHEHHHPMNRGFDEFFGFLTGEHAYLPTTGGRRAAAKAAEEAAGASKAAAKGKKKAGPTGDESEGAGTSPIYRGKTQVEEKEYLTDAFAREAVSFIERKKDAPFLLYLPFNAVHLPFQATQKYLDRFANVADMKRRTSYAMTVAMDDAIGRVLDALKSNGLEDNTLVVFASDNGGPMYTGTQSNGPLRAGKLFLFEGGVRVPMIVRWPAVLKQGAEFHGVASTLDWLPTFAAAAGLKLPEAGQFEGVDLLPFLKGEKPGSPHDWLYWRNGTNRAVRYAGWKLVQAGDYVWLFDLTRDLGETKNVADKNPAVVKQLKGALNKWEKGLKPSAWPARPGNPVEIDGVKYEIQI